MSFWGALAGTIVVILLMEYVLWKVFMRKMRSLILPHETDVSSMRFFSPGRVRALAVVHVITMVIVIVAFYSFLWS